MPSREEPWGRINYQPEFDEFEAEVMSSFAELTIRRPISVGCLVTGKCNLRCSFCYGNEEALPKGELGADVWSLIFRKLASWGVMRVDLSGGEPTLRRDIGQIASAALNENLVVILSTNGLIKNVSIWDALPKDLRIHVSLDSGFQDVHERSRLKRNLLPSKGSFQTTLSFISDAMSRKFAVRVLTCVGPENSDQLFELGECLALAGVVDWNISRILPAGRAAVAYADRWKVQDETVMVQVRNIRKAFPWMRIRFSSRTCQNGYFLLVLPDGTLATQHTDGRDKIPLGQILEMELSDLERSKDFVLAEHARRWIACAFHRGDVSRN